MAKSLGWVSCCRAVRARLGWRNGMRSKVNGLGEGKEEEEGWVFSQPAPLSSFSLKPAQWGPSRMSPRTWGSGTEPEPHIRRWGRREGTTTASRQAAMSDLHLKLNPAFPPGTQIETSYLVQPLAWERLGQQHRAEGRGGGGGSGWVGPRYTRFVSERVSERGGQHWWASIWDRLI